MTIGIWVLGDQLHAGQAALASADPGVSRVLLVESSSVLAQRAVHQQKLTLVWSAMRHFALELQAQGWTVDYIEALNFTPAVQDWIQAHGIEELRLMEPADRGFRLAIDQIPLRVPPTGSQAMRFSGVVRTLLPGPLATSSCAWSCSNAQGAAAFGC